jgi:hypothetical protein
LVLHFFWTCVITRKSITLFLSFFLSFFLSSVIILRLFWQWRMFYLNSPCWRSFLMWMFNCLVCFFFFSFLRSMAPSVGDISLRVISGGSLPAVFCQSKCSSSQNSRRLCWLVTT